MSHGVRGSLVVDKIFLVQKNRLIQACPIQVKDKSVQTSTDDNVLKQLEQKDKRISELEKSLLKSKKQIDKNSKLEKEISELRAINLRQSKELESVKSMKKKHKVRASNFQNPAKISSCGELVNFQCLLTIDSLYTRIKSEIFFRSKSKK